MAYHVFIGYSNLIMTFGIVYAVISPLILPFSLLYCLIAYCTWKHEVGHQPCSPLQRASRGLLLSRGTFVPSTWHEAGTRALCASSR